ncbi:MAG: AAA family ATPase [Lachnospiraceae bacterium]|nr:AAA family ATPase [Lachnospiraceae bacterium]
MSKSPITGTYAGITREDEEKKLSTVRKVAEQKIEEIKAQAAGLQEDLKSLRAVYDTDEKEGLAQWFNTDARFAEVRRDLNRAERAGHKPFFGRIDIEDPESAKRETFYIGKTVIADNPSEPMVIDWRAPISSVYYDSGLGTADYKVPGEGIYRVDLQRKRTYEIQDEKLVDFYDSDVVANDDLLTKYLSENKRKVLGEIIATIQQEQNHVIRKNPRHNMLIQGSAGSGKTTVAMHRISYILYNYELEFKPESFYIVGSNKVLLNYITGVLPDLDVYGVSQMTMEELFTRLLYEDWNKKKTKIRKFDKKDTTVSIKSGSEWFKALEEFCSVRELSIIPIEDIKLEKNDHLILSADSIRKTIKEYGDKPLVRKFERLNDLLRVGLENEMWGRHYTYNPEEQKKLTFKYKDWFNRFYLRDSVFDVYDEFVKSRMATGLKVSYEKAAPDLYDLAGLAYIYKRLKEKEVIQEASHVVIDEAQDFGMAAYRSLKYCMSHCTFTVMGDVSQNINFGMGLSDWEELKTVLLPDKFDYFGLLRKSYRNTVEISEFATDILRHGTFPIYPVEPIIRHGNGVRVRECKDENELLSHVIERIDEYKERKLETIAVICEDQAEAGRVADRLSKDHDLKLLTDGDTELEGGLFVLPVEYAKGLEFDAVIVYDASNRAYPKDDGHAKLLYVAATRALHDLSVFSLGPVTALVSDPVPEERRHLTFKDDDFHIEPFEFEEEFKTKEQQAKEQSLLGDGELALRHKYGPKRIVVVNGKVEKDASTKPVNKSPHQPTSAPPKPTAHKPTGTSTSHVYGESLIKKPDTSKPSRPALKTPKAAPEFYSMPEGTSLTPAGHGRIDNSVRWIKKDKTKVEITGGYGTLTIIPIREDTVRILFAKGEIDKVRALPGEVGRAEGLKWKCVETRDTVEIVTDKLAVKIPRKTGAVEFISKALGPLLSEKTELSRQYHGSQDMWWEYFDFNRKEIITTLDADNQPDWRPLIGEVRFVSHGEGSEEPALIMSNKGYQLIVPAGIKTLFCALPAYGPYVRFESEYIDYIFRTAK